MPHDLGPGILNHGLSKTRIGGDLMSKELNGWSMDIAVICEILTADASGTRWVKILGPPVSIGWGFRLYPSKENPERGRRPGPRPGGN